MPRGGSLLLLGNLLPLNTLDLIVIQSDLHQIVQIFLLHVYMINSDFTTSSEYFILWGDKSYMN